MHKTTYASFSYLFSIQTQQDCSFLEVLYLSTLAKSGIHSEKMEINPELINQFKEFTGNFKRHKILVILHILGNSDDNVARNTLVACDGNLEQAVGLFFASDGAIGANPQQNHQAPPAAVVNEINSDDEVEILDESRGRQNRPIVLDDSDVDEDGVRRPMQPVTERLVGQSYRQYYGL